MPATLALIHTTPLAVPIFTNLCQEIIPDVPIFHIVDESLLGSTIRAGRLEKITIRRLLNQVESAQDAGAGAVLVTCSSIGPAIALAQELFDFPVIRVDLPMAEEAVRIAMRGGARIGVLASLPTTLEPTAALMRETAARQAKGCVVSTALCQGAFEAVSCGDTATHDRLVKEKLLDLARNVDVIVLAQASMSRVVDQIPPGEIAIPVLSSPRLAVQRVRRAMELAHLLS